MALGFDQRRLGLQAVFLMISLSIQATVAQECKHSGGWSLRSEGKCPRNAAVDCGKKTQHRCCPNGLTCEGKGYSYTGNYCCPAGMDGALCIERINKQPKCPDPTWNLWGVPRAQDTGEWCCMPGYNGTYTLVDGDFAYQCTPNTTTDITQGVFWAEMAPSASCTLPSITILDEPTNSMSGGAIAGAVIGGVFGAVILAAVLYFLWRRRKRPGVSVETVSTTAAGAYGDDKSQIPQVSQPSQPSQPSQSGFTHGSGDTRKLVIEETPAEMESPFIYELDARPLSLHELPSPCAESNPMKGDQDKV
ncbi:hypothetical protein CI238_09515 [Colletotrichum incanum]|uniref:Epidermal growth factor receptor-like transmembrane-juxtamembrane segment domain-containing protein n=1 Tax=Colletotrichum incanum TaxID=1573173 RepID=A0A166R9J7_COLIC|nr:hypothetical protein CI238_09515 [Colletotrichum incanum]